MASAPRAIGTWATAISPDSRDFKWNNYLSRYHMRHCDLMDVLAMYNGRANAPLDQMAKLCGFPGKMGMDGSKVWDAFQQGQLQEIRDYCETDAANTYLMFMLLIVARRLQPARIPSRNRPLIPPPQCPATRALAAVLPNVATLKAACNHVSNVQASGAHRRGLIGGSLILDLKRQQLIGAVHGIDLDADNLQRLRAQSGGYRLHHHR